MEAYLSSYIDIKYQNHEICINSTQRWDIRATFHTSAIKIEMTRWENQKCESVPIFKFSLWCSISVHKLLIWLWTWALCISFDFKLNKCSFVIYVFAKNSIFDRKSIWRLRFYCSFCSKTSILFLLPRSPLVIDREVLDPWSHMLVFWCL